MKFCRCSSVQTASIEHSFPKLNILQVERTRRKKEQKKCCGRNTSKVRAVSGDEGVDTVVTEFVTSHPLYTPSFPHPVSLHTNFTQLPVNIQNAWLVPCSGRLKGNLHPHI